MKKPPDNPPVAACRIRKRSGDIFYGRVSTGNSAAAALQLLETIRAFSANCERQP
jgi:hypothetical protein